jgi:PQQ-like domain
VKSNGIGTGIRFASILCTGALLLSSCGGGGGGASPAPPPPPPAALTFTPATATVSTQAGASGTATLTATPATGLPSPLYVKLLNPPTAVAPTLGFTASAGSTYSLSIQSSTSLAQGSYTGNLSVQICSDAACTVAVAGSPVSVPYTFTITAGPPPQVFAPTPAALTATFTAGMPPALSVTLTPTPIFTAALFVQAAPGGLVQSPLTITANAGGTYTLSLTPLTTLAPGHVIGTVTLKLCYDAACTKSAPGSPVSLPYSFTIVAPPPAFSFVPTTLAGNFVQGSPFPSNIVVQANPSPFVSGPYYVSVKDATGTFSSAASLGYLDPTKNYLLLQTQAVSTLAPGTYTGDVQLTICNDVPCQYPVVGSPVTVPFNVTIAPAPANAGLTTLTAWPGVAGWVTYQGNDSHTGFVPVTLDPTRFAYRWAWNTPSTATDAKAMSTLTVAGGQVYIDSGTILYALKEFDNSTLWIHDFSNIVYAGIITAALNPPAVSGTNVYIATSAQTATYMFGLAANNGTVRFQSAFSSQWEHYLAPTISNGIVYTDGGEYGGLLAFDGTTGTLNFTAYEQQYDYWTPAVDANYAYAYTGGTLNWVDKSTGVSVGSVVDPTWAWAGYDMHGAPVLGAANSVICINTGNQSVNSLLDFNTNTKALAWSSAGPYAGNPAYAGGTLYALNKTPMRLEARNEASGALLWSWSPPTISETSYVGDVLLTNNLVFLSTNTTIYAIDATTHQSVWSLPTSGYLALSEYGVLYVVEVVSGSTTGNVFALNVK